MRNIIARIFPRRPKAKKADNIPPSWMIIVYCLLKQFISTSPHVTKPTDHGHQYLAFGGNSFQAFCCAYIYSPTSMREAIDYADVK
jgi:hypothetical protein